MSLEEEVRRDMAGIGKRLKLQTAGESDPMDLPDEDRFQVILGRIRGLQSAVLRVAQKLDQMG